MLARAWFVVLVAACGGKYGGEPPVQHPQQPGSPNGIADAALPFTILESTTGHQVDTNAFWDKLATKRVVCVGEQHKDPHDHWVEYLVVQQLTKKWSHAALGMEMFQRPFQGVLDDFAAKKIDVAALKSRSGWDDRWGFSYDFYGPTIQIAVDAHAALLALNAARELTKKVAHHGVPSLAPDERAQLPAEIVLTDKKHRAWFDGMMEGMGGEAHSPHGAPPPADPSTPPVKDIKEEAPPPDMPTADNIYAVQVIWDETMADGAIKWLAANKDGHVIILAGSGHCHDSGIIGRLRRRGIAESVSLRTVVDDGQGGVAEELAKPNTDFLFVLDLPEDAKKKLREQNKDE